MDNLTLGSGSYPADDVTFLVAPLEIALVDVATKEQLIQSGKKHYSEMLSEEKSPSEGHLALYNAALAHGGHRLAHEVIALAKALASEITARPIVLTSLVRAGVPLGVFLKRALTMLGVDAVHYGISIIRDRGIDDAALARIEARHGTAGICFIDGWTGKGAISKELSRSLKGRPGYDGIPRLVVLADPGGCAWLAASGDDWLIPFGILGATVSGLISRSVYQEPPHLHGARHWHHLQHMDCSAALANHVSALMAELAVNDIPPASWTDNNRATLWSTGQQVVDALAAKHQITNLNRVKPGIAEATRAVMRRVPEMVYVRSVDDPDVALLMLLANKAGVPITEVGDTLGSYRAVTIIQKVT